MKPPYTKLQFPPVPILWLCLLVWQFSSLRSAAVVDASSRSNTNAPADGSPWGNIGTVNFASATYLGAGWALTARHVGAGDLNLGGTLFPWDGTSVRLTNSNGSSNDLVMFHLKSLPPLPRLPLTTTTPTALSSVDLIAYGLIASSGQTNFGLGQTGFYWSGSGYKSWGNNQVDTGGTVVQDAGQGPVTLFATTFSQVGQTSDEAQAAPGDSGGGVFQKLGPAWQLAGLLLYTSALLPNQPPNTSVYGQLTFAADIATYQPQIQSVITNTIPGLSISRASNNVLVCWPDTGVTWKLTANQNLTTASWQTLTPPLTLTNGQFCALIPMSNSHTFFRLQK